MKKLLVMMGFMVLSTVTFAQRGGGNATPEMRAEMQTKRMTEKLSLTEAQQKKVYDLQLKRVQNMQKMREAQQESATARQDMKAANDDYEKSLSTILTAAQNEQYQAMQTEMRQSRGGDRGRSVPADTTQTRKRKSRGPR